MFVYAVIGVIGFDTKFILACELNIQEVVFKNTFMKICNNDRRLLGIPLCIIHCIHMLSQAVEFFYVNSY